MARRKQPRKKFPTYRAQTLKAAFDLARSSAYGPGRFPKEEIHKIVKKDMKVMGRKITGASRRYIDEAIHSGALGEIYNTHFDHMNLTQKGLHIARQGRSLNRGETYSCDASELRAVGLVMDKVVKPEYANCTKADVTELHLDHLRKCHPQAAGPLERWSTHSTIAADEDVEMEAEVEEVEEVLTPRASPAPRPAPAPAPVPIRRIFHPLPGTPAFNAAEAYPSPESAPRPSRGESARQIPETPIASSSRVRIEDMPANPFDDEEEIECTGMHIPYADSPSHAPGSNRLPSASPARSPPPLEKTVSLERYRTLEARYVKEQAEVIRLQERVDAMSSDQIMVKDLQKALAKALAKVRRLEDKLKRLAAVALEADNSEDDS
ncbi:hypothetical protein EUX98_g2157 [Antrodiella citrinella]|uniref:Uncharacterized protein n=1 Tax=Antrodiella citrinella TaxID=2447956 RepID=A0A4V3XJ83_9APHY|nr:hypothetical protein EUX98_g2157 [Antrodiella citrinella]